MLSLPLLVILPTHSHWHNTVGNDVGISLFALVLAAAGFWMARRLAISGLWLGDDRIVVKGPLKTKLLSPADVERFVPGVWGGGNGTPCPVLKCHHGPAVGVWALGREGVIWRYARYAGEMDPLCDQLNEVLHGLKPSGGTGVSAPAR